MHVPARFVSVALLADERGLRQGTKSTDELIADLKSSQEQDRIIAVRFLPDRKVDAAKIVPAMIECLKDKRGRRPPQPAIGLGSFGEEARPAIPAAQAARKDRDARVRRAAGDRVLAHRSKTSRDRLAHRSARKMSVDATTGRGEWLPHVGGGQVGGAGSIMAAGPLDARGSQTGAGVPRGRFVSCFVHPAVHPTHEPTCQSRRAAQAAGFPKPSSERYTTIFWWPWPGAKNCFPASWAMTARWFRRSALRCWPGTTCCFWREGAGQKPADAAVWPDFSTRRFPIWPLPTPRSATIPTGR